MFVPKHFEFNERAALFRFIEAYSFGVLVTQGEGEYAATHLPFVVNAEENCLYAHLSRANPQVQVLQGCESALAIFSGEHAYVSPRWYVSDNNVPTWNYSAVHVTLRPSMLDEAGTIAVVDALSAVNESNFSKPWSSALVDQRQLGALYRGIVGFRLDIDVLQGKRKLSQNKSLEDRQSVVRGLQESSSGKGVARDMGELQDNAEDEGRFLRLQCLKDEFSLHRLPPDAEIPSAVLDSKIYWIGKTDEELSVVCDCEIAVSSDQNSEGWSCFKICGPLDLGMTGVLAGIAAVLRDAHISIFALSTFDTDYVLVKSATFESAKNALSAAGYEL